METGLQTPVMIDQDQDKTVDKWDPTSIVEFWHKNNRQMIDQIMKTEESLI